ncbi:hypothetical protein ERO13_A07G060700v2 [Gossypium hirsutum]|nr:hypothetical protein ERO13_A07G060700v2 [Gossypium hirsutum]
MSTLSVPPVLTSPRDDAIQLYRAFKGLGCDTAAVVNILSHRDVTQRSFIQHEYKTMYSEDLLKRLKSELRGKLELLLAYLSTHRHEGPEVDREMALKDAKTLFKAGEKKLGTDEKKFIRIFSERSRAQLAAISSAYHDIYGGSLKKAVKSETSGEFEHGLLTILKCSQNPAKYFAKVLHQAMKGLGTNDTTVIRVIVTRTEIDMHYIKAEYMRKYKKSLNDAVHSETSGHYQTFLLSLLGPSH